jgi:glycosyltransferase involved in cell wall biosynthesis
MNILLVAPMPPRVQAPGAIPVVLHAQLQGLLRHHAVTVVTVAGPEPGEWEAVQQLRADGVEIHAAHRVEPRGWPRWQRRRRLASTWLRGQWPWRTAWFWDAQVQRLLDRLLAERRFDVIQIEDNAMGVYRYPASTPKVFSEYEVRRPRRWQWRSAPVRQWPRWLLSEADWQRWPGYQRRVWQKFERLQVFTQRDADNLKAIAPDLAGRVRVNPFAVEMPTLSGMAEERDTLLFVGNFAHPPNIDAALWLGREIMPRVRARRASASLTIVGIFAPPAVLALAGDGISVTGVVPEMAPYFERAAVVVAPVRMGGGMRMKVLQAMAFGKPVVTTGRGAEGLTVKGTPLPLVTAEDSDGIARALADLLVDAGRRCTLGQAARAYVADHFSPQAYASRQEAVYAELSPP